MSENRLPDLPEGVTMVSVKIQDANHKDVIAKALFGTSFTGGQAERTCVTCSKPVGPFKDSLSSKEYRISGMCQACQDSVFESEEEEGEELPEAAFWRGDPAGLGVHFEDKQYKVCLGDLHRIVPGEVYIVRKVVAEEVGKDLPGSYDPARTLTGYRRKMQASNVLAVARGNGHALVLDID